MYASNSIYQGIIAFVERQFNLLKRYLSWEIVFLFYTVVNTLTIGLIGVEFGGAQSSSRVLYLVIGALMWGYLSIIFHEVAESISWERWEGTIEFTFASPIHRLVHLSGMCTYASVYGMIRTVVVMVVVTLFFELHLGQANFLGALLVLVTSSLALMGLGLIAAVFPVLSPEKGSQASHILEGFLLLISGVYYEVSVLPAWMQPLSRLSPATYTIRAIRAAILNGASTASLLPDIGKLLLTGIILFPLGYAIFQRVEHWALKTGKLKRTG
ncbi:MAG: ABC transporter permease [bacterium]|jgi:ABC-2 type transport system permease protein|nr:ABC transporter permease [bacterium]